MRFLLEFAACCGCVPPRTSAPTTSRYEEERRSFEPQPSCPLRRSQKQRRLTPAAEWSPTLVPICEDDDDVLPQRCDSIQSDSEGKKRSVTAKALHIQNIHDYAFRRRGGSNIMTAFYPVPFMF